jgi:hypothetical protein
MPIRKVPDLPRILTDPLALNEQLQRLADDFVDRARSSFHHARPYRAYARSSQPVTGDTWAYLMWHAQAAAYRNAAYDIMRLWHDYPSADSILADRLSACEEGTCGHDETGATAGTPPPADTGHPGSQNAAAPAATAAVPSRGRRGTVGQPVVITTSSRMRDELTTCAHEAAATLDYAESVPQGRKLARRASMVIIGPDQANKVHKPITCPHGPVIVATFNADDMPADRAERIGAQIMLIMPMGRAWLIDRLLGRDEPANIGA